MTILLRVFAAVRLTELAADGPTKLSSRPERPVPACRGSVVEGPAVPLLVAQQNAQVAQGVVRGASDQGVAQRSEERVGVETSKGGGRIKSQSLCPAHGRRIGDGAGGDASAINAVAAGA